MLFEEFFTDQQYREFWTNHCSFQKCESYAQRFVSSNCTNFLRVLHLLFCSVGEIGFDSFVMPDIRLDDPLYVASVRPPPDSEVGSPDASGAIDAVPEEMPMEVDIDEEAQPNVDQVEVTESDFHQPAKEPVADDLSDYGNYYAN